MTTPSGETHGHIPPVAAQLAGAVKVVLATENQGKVRELQALLGVGVEVLDLRGLGITPPPETGFTFAENAIAKAEFASLATGLPAVADDSGLEVTALKGAPGVRSARYAGETATDAENRTKLLAALANVPTEKRGARFVSVIAIATPREPTETFFGACDGTIAFAEQGSGGFGYDSVFQLPDGTTMAELTPEEKNAISHRGQAMRLAVPVLLNRLEAFTASMESERHHAGS